MFDLFKTDTERKRDQYHKLYEKLKDALQEHDKKVSEANASYSSYISAVPNLLNTKIPSNDFDPKREELNRKLNKYFDNEKDMRGSLVTAINKANERYIHYKNLAIKEAEAEQARREKELRELIEKVEGFFSGKR
ncbi:chorismate synthase [Heyndrickxia sporothermodurans]|uniref:chorismate synthase n=1 Tax=Heyndrickxia sporothermodurans TaxID=46224 RepID=UPI002E1FCE58|nr:chorismate synthase [Heyndrickxia sporothermodurans]MED3696377.1 chorismate synthase [Heyndrickxia sporothermodurans]